MASQTEISVKLERMGVEKEQQTERCGSTDEGIQTCSIEQRDAESMTTPSTSMVKSLAYKCHKKFENVF